MSAKVLRLFSGEVVELALTPPVLGASFVKATIDESHDAEFQFSYEIDLENASDDIITTLPDAAEMIGGRVAVKFTSFSSSYYWQLNTTSGQNVDQYSSGELKTQGLPENDVKYTYYEFEANTAGDGWNIVAKYKRF